MAVDTRPPRLSRLVLGMWRLVDRDVATDELQGLIEHAIALGVTRFDQPAIISPAQFTMIDTATRAAAQRHEVR